MRLVVSDAKVLKSVVNALASLITEARLAVSPEGISLRAMDPAHVVLAELRMSRTAFEEYRVESSQKLGIDFDRLNTILKRAGSSDRIELSLSEDASALVVTIRNSAVRRFDLPLIDVGEEEIRVPEPEFLAEVGLDPKLLSEAMKDAEIVSDCVTLRCDFEYLYISARDELGSAEVKVSREQAVSFRVAEPCRSTYSLEYLRDMLRAADAASSVELWLGNDSPVLLELLTEGTKLRFFLAPRIVPEET